MISMLLFLVLFTMMSAVVVFRVVVVPSATGLRMIARFMMGTLAFPTTGRSIAMVSTMPVTMTRMVTGLWMFLFRFIRIRRVILFALLCWCVGSRLTFFVVRFVAVVAVVV